jgi:hypothetical protein
VRARLSLEPLSDRVLPSADINPDLLASRNLSQDLVAADCVSLRFVEVPQGASWFPYWEAQQFPISSQQMSDIFGGVSHLEQLGTPSVSGGAVELAGETFPSLLLQFGSSVSITLIGQADVAGAPGGSGPAASSRGVLLGGVVEVNSNGGKRRFLMGRSDMGPNEQATPSLPNELSLANGTQATPSLPNELSLVNSPPSSGGFDPSSSAPSAATTGSSLATFLAGWSSGNQIASDLLAARVADDSRGNRTAEVAVNNPGNPAAVLLTVDTVLPHAKADLVRLQKADLAIVPTYLVGAASVAPVAPPRPDEQPDLGLTTHVVGLDEVPPGVSRAAVSTDRLFELLASADGAHGMEARSLLVEAGVRPEGSEVCEAPAAGAMDAGLALREWLEGVLNQSGNRAEVVATLALEGLLVAYVYRRRLVSRKPRSRVEN